MRLGELIALTWDDVDFGNHIININKTICKCKKNNKYVLITSKPKTESSCRLIPINKEIITLLKQLKKISIGKYVISKNGKQKCIRSYQQSFKNLLKLLKIKENTFHCLRHTFVTRMLELGINPKMVSEIIGHSKVDITLNRYNKCFLEEKRKTIEKLTKRITKKLTY